MKSMFYVDEVDKMYPTEKELKAISEWRFLESYELLMDYIKQLWEYADLGYFRQEDNKYYLSTGGWSGNEYIILSLQENYTFWGACWYSSKRGGHHEFVIPERFMRNK